MAEHTLEILPVGTGTPSNGRKQEFLIYTAYCWTPGSPFLWLFFNSRGESPRLPNLRHYQNPDQTWKLPFPLAAVVLFVNAMVMANSSCQEKALEKVQHFTPEESLAPKLENCRRPELQSNSFLEGLNDGQLEASQQLQGPSAELASASP